MKTQRDNLIRRLTMLLLAIALALLLIWGGRFVRADETSNINRSIATLTDATDTEEVSTTESVTAETTTTQTTTETTSSSSDFTDGYEPRLLGDVNDEYLLEVFGFDWATFDSYSEEYCLNNLGWTKEEFKSIDLNTHQPTVDGIKLPTVESHSRSSSWKVNVKIEYAQTFSTTIYGDDGSVAVGSSVPNTNLYKITYNTASGEQSFYGVCVDPYDGAPVGEGTYTITKCYGDAYGVLNNRNSMIYIAEDTFHTGILDTNGHCSSTHYEWFNYYSGNSYLIQSTMFQGVHYACTWYHTDKWLAGGKISDITSYCCWGSEGTYFEVSTGDDSKQRLIFLGEEPETPNGSLELYKVSGNERVTANNSCYSLKGAEYKLKKSDGSYVKDIDGNEVTLVTDANGYATADRIPEGSYTLEEVTAPRGFNINTQPLLGTINITHGTKTSINTTDSPGLDPINIALKKANSNNQMLAGAQYTIKYYKNQQTLNAAALLESNLSDTWVMQTGDGFNGTLKGLVQMKDAYKVSGPDFYLDENNNAAFPLGTVTIQETKAPFGYKKNDEIHVFYVKQNADGTTDIIGPTGIIDENEALYDDLEHDLPVTLTLKKVNVDNNPAQGNTGDATLDGAVFALYAKRDIMDVAAGTVAVEGGEVYTARTALKFADGTPVVDAYGNQVYAEVGDPIPVAIFNPTDAKGESTMTGLKAANNADDYYARELVAPLGFKRNTEDISLDLRDNTDKTTTLESIPYTYTINETPNKQPVSVFKYELVQEGNAMPTIETVNGVEFQIYLISSLKNREDAIKFVNSDGSVVYDFTNYDFSEETPIVVTADGSTTLVTGSTGIDGYVETIDLYFGEYVLVETKTLDRLEPVSPKVFSVPKYKTDANGKVLIDSNGDPQMFSYCDLNVLNVPTEKYLKIDKVNEEGNFILHNNATFSIWDISDLDASQVKTVEDIKANAKQVTQYQQTTTGMVPVTEFSTNDEGFLVLYEAFKYGDYAIIEEKSPTGYSLSKEPVIFRVRSEAVYLMMNGNWEECTVYKDATDREYWEVSVTNVDYEINAAIVDYDTGDFVPNAEMTIR